MREEKIERGLAAALDCFPTRVIYIAGSP